MNYYKVYPEVPAFMGINTQFDKNVIPWRITHLHANFQGWLGSTLLLLDKCYFVTIFLKEKILLQELSGINTFNNMEITKGELFLELYGENKYIPTCYWLDINGIGGKDDIGLIENDLILSERFMSLIEDDLKIGIMDVEKYFLEE